jgi:PAS domain S-box-containing protein
MYDPSVVKGLLSRCDLTVDLFSYIIVNGCTKPSIAHSMSCNGVQMKKRQLENESQGFQWASASRGETGHSATITNSFGDALIACDNDKKKAMEALQRTHGLIQSITQGTGDIIAALDLDFRCIFMNEAHRQETKKLWGLDVEIGSNLLEKLAPWPEELEKARGLWTRAFNGESFRLTTEFGPSNQERRFYEMYFNPVYDFDGRQIGAAHIYRNITEQVCNQRALQESEKKFKIIFNSSQCLMSINSLEDGRFIEVNDAFVRITGYSREETLGRSLQEIWERPSSAHDPQKLLALLNSHHCLQDIEAVLRTRSGEYRTGIFWSEIITIENKPYLLSEWLDITERKEAEKALRQLNETLEQQVAERTGLAEARTRQLQTLTMEVVDSEERVRKKIALLLHEDLQQLLAGAKLQLQAACQTIADKGSLQNFMKVDALLTESIEKSRCLSQELSPPILHYSGLIPGLEWLCQYMEEQFDLHVTLQSDTSLPVERLSLKIFLYRAVQELLFNIVKHARVKHAMVQLFDSESEFGITVSDEGTGFNPEILESTAGKIGFGLMSLRERSRSIGGDMVIESTPGQGSRFTVTIPAKLAGPIESSILKPTGKNAPPASQKLFIFDEIRVLFTDDHQVMREGLIKMVQGQPNIKVVGEASNGKEAIKQVRTLKPDVVVMDVSMPKMNGIEATRQIKARWPDIRVIGLSMYQDAHIAQKMQQAGAELLLSKTASSSDLLQAIYGRE